MSTESTIENINTDKNANTNTNTNEQTNNNIEELRKRSSKIEGNAEVDGPFCPVKPRPKKGALFVKSLKFFSFVFFAGLFTSIVFEMITGANQVYVYYLIGLAVSTLATYYKVRVWMDPSYQPDCDCPQPTAPEGFIPSKDDMMKGVFSVLGHKKSALLFNVPNTVFGIMFYSFMILITYYQVYMFGTFLLTLVSCSGSLYLWYTMINEVKAVCVICSTIHAINFLTLLALL